MNHVLVNACAAALCAGTLGAGALSAVVVAQAQRERPMGGTRPIPPVLSPRDARPTPRAQPPLKNQLFPAQDLGLLEPPDRDQWQPAEQIMDDLGIADGAVVADLGAGGGWFTIRLGRRVGPHGVVYAEDVQAPMLDAIRRRAQRENLSNIRTVLGTSNDPKLPGTIDAALIVDTYHEMACAARPSCEEPTALLRNVARSLSPQGRLGVVDFFPGEGGPGPSPDERIDPDMVVKAAAAAGLQLLARKSFSFQYLLVFGRAPKAKGPT